MSKHLAPTSVKTLAAELIFNAIFGEDTPDRDGRHRAVEAPRTWSYAKAHTLKTPDACIPCEQVTVARKKAAA